MDQKGDKGSWSRKTEEGSRSEVGSTALHYGTAKESVIMPSAHALMIFPQRAL